MLIEMEVVVGLERRASHNRWTNGQAAAASGSSADGTMSPSIDGLISSSGPDAFEAVAATSSALGQFFVTFLTASPAW